MAQTALAWQEKVTQLMESIQEDLSPCQRIAHLGLKIVPNGEDLSDSVFDMGELLQRIEDEEGRAVCTSRLTVMLVPQPDKPRP